MSYNAKNLSYETKEPPFLQKLRAQYGGTDGRLERPVARPRRPKDNDDDDEPTYVDEESNEVVSKEEYNALVHGTDQKEGPGAQDPEQDKPASGADADETNADKQPPTSTQNLAEIGGPKKRKQVKVIAEDSLLEAEEPKDDNSHKSKTKKKSEKKKKIKLSFDDQ